jgi:hypothetical protein
MVEGTVVVDSKYRVVLERKVRAVAGIGKGEKLIAIPFHGGVILTSAAGKRFAGSLRGFGFREDDHEAGRYLAKLAKTDADS